MDSPIVTIPLDDPELSSACADLAEGDKVTIEGTVSANGPDGLQVSVEAVEPTEEEAAEPAAEAPAKPAATKSPTSYAIAQRNKRAGRSSMPGNMPMSGA